MHMISDIHLEVDKTKVFKVIKLTKDSPSFNEINRIYDSLEKEMKNIAFPKIIYKLGTKIEKNVTNEYDKSHASLYMITTLGKEMSELSAKYFCSNQYLEGMLIDAMGDDLLFTLTKKSYEYIDDFAKRKKIGLTQKLSPGDNIPMGFQKDILQKIDPEGYLDISITDGFMLRPLKSMAFMYGVKRKDNLKIEKEHDCRSCNRIDCPWREGNGYDG